MASSGIGTPEILYIILCMCIFSGEENLSFYQILKEVPDLFKNINKYYSCKTKKLLIFLWGLVESTYKK